MTSYSKYKVVLVIELENAKNGIPHDSLIQAGVNGFSYASFCDVNFADYEKVSK